jgi:hypothetical protein
MRYLAWITIGVLLGCLLVLIVFLIFWRFFSSPVPSPTPSAGFVTITPVFTEVSGVSSPTPVTATVTLSPTAIPTSTPTATPVPTVTPSPIVYTPTLVPMPHAVVNGPNGFVNVRSGPGLAYAPPLGTYGNGTVVEVFGKQYSSEGALWWYVPFPVGSNGRGWIYADFTDARYIDQVPWVNAPSTPTPVYVSPTPVPTPQAIINSPDGFLYVRSGPGVIYDPPLGAYNNGAVVDIIGKQVASDGALWWLIPFLMSPNGRGWIYADFTIAKYTNNVPWAPVPPTPTPSVTHTPTPTRTPVAPPIVTWTITGRVVDAANGQPIAGATVEARLGYDGTLLTGGADGNGNFSIVGQAHDDGNLWLTVTAPGYVERTITAGAVSPRVYDFPAIELMPQAPPVVTWVVLGRVVEIGTNDPIPNAYVEARLGIDAVRLDTLTGVDGQFSLSGQARDSGFLGLDITADGYQSLSKTLDQTDSRIYNLADLPLIPLAGSCAYESVINLPQTPALARLQSLRFTNVTTISISVGGNQNLVDLVLTQDPDPPPEGQSIRLNCQIPIVLGVGEEDR